MRSVDTAPARRTRRPAGKAGRITLQPIHVTDALPRAHREAVIVVETHLWLRQAHRDEHAPLEVLDDGTLGCFLTVERVRRLLRMTGARYCGEKTARRVLNEILPALGLIEDTGLVKKPAKRHPYPGEGGRHAQPSLHRSRWWRIYRLPPLTRHVTPKCGAYNNWNGDVPPRAWGSASLSALLSCQGLIPERKRRVSFQRGSVQWAFANTGPP
ncbi:MAG TPA: hypothetical protein VFA97_03660 [Gaiellaceae bacterium]|nr:hypothetical protein [Gaiellaceae bacterium]